MDIAEVDATRFAEAFEPIASSPLWGPFLTPYGIEDFRRMRCFLACGECVGGAIKPTMAGKELVSLFNNGGPAGSGRAMIGRLVAEGATRLECTGGHLKALYQRFGFEVVQTLGWNERYAPSGWDYATWGRPEIYVMERR